MPRDKRKSKAPPSNAKAMCDILRLFETSTTVLQNKEQRTNWLETELLRHQSYPYPGTRKDVGAYHNAESLYEAITYAVRDGKKDEFKSMKGQAAIDQFFSIGRDMLKGEYLLSIGYQTTDEKKDVKLQQRADGDEQYDVPAAMPKVDSGPSVAKAPKTGSGKPLTSKGQKQKSGAELHSPPIPRVTRKNSRLLSSQPVQAAASEPELDQPNPHPNLFASPIEEEEHEVIYEPVRPASSITKRKRTHLQSSSEYGEPMAAHAPGSRLSPLEHGGTLPEATIRQDLIRLRETIVDISTDICPANERPRLKGWPSQALFNIYADIFGCAEWRHVFEDIVEYSDVRSAHLLQVVTWTFLELRIFRKPLPWPSLTLQSNVDNLIGASEAARARWKRELHAFASKISLEQLEEPTLLSGVIRPKGNVEADELEALVLEHLAGRKAPLLPEALRVLPEQLISALRGICTEALLLHGRMIAANCVYRMIRHKSGSPVYHELPSEAGGRARKQRKDVVALTIAPGLERKEAQEVEGVVVERIVTIEAAMIIAS